MAVVVTARTGMYAMVITMMRRFAMGVEYDGTAYCGWQRQPHAPSVQALVEKAVSRVADHALQVVCAGRTDTGVHATGQVIHFETRADRTNRSWLLGTNANLPRDIRSQWVLPAETGFHARFSALARSYRYIILNQSLGSALWRDRVCWEHRQLDEHRMQKGACYLVGEHDFTSFRSLACQAKNPVRTIENLRVTRNGKYLTIDVVANAFLHHMVRTIAGALIAVGSGEKKPDWIQEVLECRDRKKSGVTAPASGLYLVGVRYPREFGFPAGGDLPLPGQTGKNPCRAS